MPPTQQQLRSVTFLGWMLLVTNLALLLIFHFQPEWMARPELMPFLTSFSIVAAFPLDFLVKFWIFMNGAQYFWIGFMLICLIGILQYNNLARISFISCIIFHIGILFTLLFLRGPHSSLDYLFVFYFNLVVFAVYLSFLTMPEVVAQFDVYSQPIAFSFQKQKKSKVSTDPRDAQRFLNLGLTYSQLKRYREAIGALKEAVRIKTNDAAVHYHLGVNYFKADSIPEAVVSLKEAVRIKPENASALYYLGLSFLKQGCHKEAAEVFEKAAEFEPNNADIQKALATAYSGLSNYPRAIEAFQKTVLLNPKDAESYYQIGLLLTQDDKAKEALASFERAIRLNPGLSEAHYHLGLTCIKLNRHKDAIRALKDKLRIDSDHPQAHYHLGVTYALIDDFDSARRELKALAGLDNDLANSLSILLQRN